MSHAFLNLSVVLPAYNEEKTIVKTISQVYNYLSRWGHPFEIIIVNDGSSDHTGRLVKSYGAKFPAVKLVEHKINLGYGEALRSGFDIAQKEWILLMDSDGQFDIADLDKFWPFIQDHQVIVGYRSKRSDPWYRSLFTWAYMIILKLFFGLKLRDIGCGFKLFRRQTWKTVQPIQSHDHKIFSVEWMLKLQKAGVAVKELPIRHLARREGKPTGARLNIIWQTVRALFHLRLNLYSDD